MEEKGFGVVVAHHTGSRSDWQVLRRTTWHNTRVIRRGGAHDLLSVIVRIMSECRHQREPASSRSDSSTVSISKDRTVRDGPQMLFRNCEPFN
jgi:hypothetical protein